MSGKFWLKSRTLWAGGVGFAVNALDLANQFITSQSLDTLCAKRSTISAAICAIVIFLRFKTSEPLSVRGKK
jgi:hypothetical protein